MIFSSLDVVVDNRAREGFKATWGLSLLLQGDRNVLFDAGPSGKALLHNMELFDIEPQDIELFFLSHAHADHSGGLRALQDAGFHGELVLPPGYALSEPGAYQAPPGEGLYPLADDMARISLRADGFYEQALLVNTARGGLLLVGCAHPGLGRLWEAASAEGPLMGVVGGFHDSLPFPGLEKAVLLGPCHCTSHREAFRREFPRTFRDLAAGDMLELQ